MVLPVLISGPFWALVSAIVSSWLSVLAYGVKGNGNGTASLGSLGLTGVVNDRLVVLV